MNKFFYSVSFLYMEIFNIFIILICCFCFFFIFCGGSYYYNSKNNKLTNTQLSTTSIVPITSPIEHMPTSSSKIITSS